MAFSYPHQPRVHRKAPRFDFRLIWRRTEWELRSSAKYRRFATLDDVMAHVRALQRRAVHTGGALCGRIEQRDPHTGRWREVPELARVWAENEWPK